MKAVRISLLALVIGGTLFSASSLYAGDRKVIQDQDGGLWCSRTVCDPQRGDSCCGGESLFM